MPKEMDDLERAAYGKRLRAARTDAGLSQQAVGDAIDCTQSFISRVEAGGMMLRAIDYPVVADLLGVDVLDLIGPLTTGERERIEARKASAEAYRDDAESTPI